MTKIVDRFEYRGVKVRVENQGQTGGRPDYVAYSYSNKTLCGDVSLLGSDLEACRQTMQAFIDRGCCDG